MATERFYALIDAERNGFIIGLNVGIGTKWPSKGWPLSRWKELIEKLSTSKYNLLLLGGPEEIETINQLKKNINFSLTQVVITLFLNLPQ